MAYIKSTGVATETVSQALREALDQATAVPAKPGDINGDGAANIFDMSILLSNWGKPGATASQGDLNSDGMVNTLDLSILLSNWNK
jgi:hypothetical protein